MKIQCPHCKAVYNIEVSKLQEIPAKGASATCKKCKNRIPIAPIHGEPEPQKEVHREEIIPCPNCGHVNISSDVCVSCGTAFSREDKEILKIILDGEG